MGVFVYMYVCLQPLSVFLPCVLCIFTCDVLFSSPVDSFEELREKLHSVCRDAEEKEAAWRIVAAENARQRLILEGR